MEGKSKRLEVNVWVGLEGKIGGDRLEGKMRKRLEGKIKRWT